RGRRRQPILTRQARRAGSTGVELMDPYDWFLLPSAWYGGVEYLLWWVKPAPLSVPLVSTGPISTTHHGWLINSDATILYGAPRSPAQGGNDSQNFPVFSGG